jgi:glutamyl-Q tRNA(Asp) synthetase
VTAPFTTRFAPSPTGRLHLGHAYSAILAHEAARAYDGAFLLRIEDIDQGRCRPEFEAGILEDLAWLGLAWPLPVRRQSDHLTDYATALERLRSLGVVYRCFLTRREVTEQAMSAPHGAGEGPDGVIYPGPAVRMSEDEEQARLARGEAFAWRLSIRYSQDLLGEEFARLYFFEQKAGPNAEQIVTARPQSLGDVILARKDTPTSYHLSVVHDDALQGVTHIIRGEDLRASTHIHVLLQRLLALPHPVYTHHPLIVGPDGKRYAKRHGAVTLAALRQAGLSPADIRARIGLTA